MTLEEILTKMCFPLRNGSRKIACGLPQSEQTTQLGYICSKLREQEHLIVETHIDLESSHILEISEYGEEYSKLLIYVAFWAV